MKKFLFLLLLIPSVMFSQARLGFNFNDVEKEFRGYQTEKKVFSKTTAFYVINVNSVFIYTFNSDMKCINTMIITKDEGYKNCYVKKCNELYFVVEAGKRWRMCSENDGYATITLTKQEDGTFVITWL